MQGVSALVRDCIGVSASLDLLGGKLKRGTPAGVKRLVWSRVPSPFRCRLAAISQNKLWCIARCNELEWRRHKF